MAVKRRLFCYHSRQSPFFLAKNGLTMAMRFCTNCGQPLTQEIPPLDNRVRDVCHACGTIHYENPKIVVCSIPYIKTARGIEVLLCLRAIEPRDNYWTLPGGFMETKETTEEAAVRETLEEAGCAVTTGALFALMNLAVYEQVHLFYLAEMKDARFAAGEESRDVKLFTEAEIPWDRLAFSTISHALRYFFDDLKQGILENGRFSVHTIDLSR